MSKVDNNKEQKRNSLLDSAFTLFIDNGFNKTSISDIVSKAGVAKGTFYLYFKDKYDIRNHLISHKANQVFQTACTELMKHKELKDFEEQVLFIIDNILDQFAQNHNLVLLLSKHLSWGFFTDFLAVAPSENRPSIYTIYQTMLAHASHTYRRGLRRRLYRMRLPRQYGGSGMCRSKSERRIPRGTLSCFHR